LLHARRALHFFPTRRSSDLQWSDDFHHALHALLTGERDGYYADFGGLGALVEALQNGFVYAGHYSEYRCRSHGRPLGAVPLNRLDRKSTRLNSSHVKISYAV